MKSLALLVLFSPLFSLASINCVDLFSQDPAVHRFMDAHNETTIPLVETGVEQGEELDALKAKSVDEVTLPDLALHLDFLLTEGMPGARRLGQKEMFGLGKELLTGALKYFVEPLKLTRTGGTHLALVYRGNTVEAMLLLPEQVNGNQVYLPTAIFSNKGLVDFLSNWSVRHGSLPPVDRSIN